MIQAASDVPVPTHRQQSGISSNSDAYRASRLDRIICWALFLYLSWILCPLRFCAATRAHADNTWFFALNYAAAHNLISGKDIVWSWGPLAYLLIPFHLGANLIAGFALQFVLWAALIFSLWDLLLRSGASIKNVAMFSMFLALSALAYSDELRPANFPFLLFLILLVHFHLSGGYGRLLAVLMLAGIMPLFQFASAVVVAGILMGLALSRIPGALRASSTWREITLLLLVPVASFLAAASMVFGSFADVLIYVRRSIELASGYPAAVGLDGPTSQLVVVLLALGLLLATFAMLWAARSERSRFFSIVFSVPVLFELRHGLMRQDNSHVTQFLCFVGLTLALTFISVPLTTRRHERVAAAILCIFFVLWWEGSTKRNFPRAAAVLSGENTLVTLSQVLHYNILVSSLDATARGSAEEFGLDPQLRQLVGQSPIAFVSLMYSDSGGQHLNLSLVPSVQLYSAYTPSLDAMNAQWIASRGPEFLAFQVLSIDNHHAWLEAPASWNAIYRWYDTRALGTRYLLLERRSRPRIREFHVLESHGVRFGESVNFPRSKEPIYWTLQCSPNLRGTLTTVLFRLPELSVTFDPSTNHIRKYRVALADLEVPSPGTSLPFNLSDYARLFADQLPFDAPVASLVFDGPGSWYYHATCELRFLQVD